MNKKCKLIFINPVCRVSILIVDSDWLSPPVPVGMDAQGRYIPGEVPKLFGGDCLNYIMVRERESGLSFIQLG